IIIFCDCLYFFFSSRRRHTRSKRDWSSDVCSSDLITIAQARERAEGEIVTVEGVITSQPGVFGDKGFYIQDETAGIYVFQHEVRSEERRVGKENRCQVTRGE